MSKFVIRLDDIVPGMHWENFSRLRELLTEYRVHPLIGVVPDNRDEGLVVDDVRSDFWDTLRKLRAEGWEIAQHGFQHVNNSSDGGILKLNERGEFAGLAYERQLHDLERGQSILRDEGLPTDVFMAPQHSFDLNTLRALKDLGFGYVSDGYGLYPYRFRDLVFVPQLFGSPIHVGFGVYTICIHPNTLTKKRLEEIARFVRKNKNRIVSFSSAAQLFTNDVKERVSRRATSLLIPLLRMAKERWLDDVRAKRRSKGRT